MLAAARLGAALLTSTVVSAALNTTDCLACSNCVFFNKSKDFLCECSDHIDWNCVDQVCDREDCNCQIKLDAQFRCWEHPQIADLWGAYFVVWQVVMLVVWSAALCWGSVCLWIFRDEQLRLNNPSKAKARRPNYSVVILAMVAIVARFLWALDPKGRN